MAEQLPIWQEAGVEPPELLKNNGWQPGMKPSAQHMNWLFNRIYKCLEEIQAGGGTEELEQELATLQQTVATHWADNIKHITGAERTSWNSKAAGTHTHTIANVTGLQSALDAKLAANLRNIANGYAGLDGNGRLLHSAIPEGFVKISETNFASNPTSKLTLSNLSAYKKIRIELLGLKIGTGVPRYPRIFLNNYESGQNIYHGTVISNNVVSAQTGILPDSVTITTDRFYRAIIDIDTQTEDSVISGIMRSTNPTYSKEPNAITYVQFVPRELIHTISLYVDTVPIVAGKFELWGVPR